jgi:serine/threonine-protein kinase mTOR
MIILQSKPEEEAANELASAALANTAASRNLSGPGSSPDDYYQTVAINALLSILRDQSQTGQHHKVIEAIMSIFKTQGLRCVAFLPQVSFSCCRNRVTLMTP